MATQTELQTQIESIEAKLRSGVDSVTVDGTSTKINLVELKKEASRLRKLLASSRMRRPVASGINLGGFRG